MFMSGFDADINRLADALGLPKTAASWSLICDRGETVVVECKFYPEAACKSDTHRDNGWTSGSPLGDALVKRYRLIEIQEDTSNE